MNQTHYPKIEVDNSETDIIQIWQNGKTDVNVIQVERDKLHEFIRVLQKIVTK